MSELSKYQEYKRKADILDKLAEYSASTATGLSLTLHTGIVLKLDKASGKYWFELAPYVNGMPSSIIEA